MYKDAMRAAWAEINLTNLDFNIKQIQKKVGPDVKLTGIIKADGYGHGSIKCASVLRANGVDSFGVATLSEAIKLRKAGYTKEQIIILGLTPEPYADILAEYDLTPVVCSYANAEAINNAARKAGKGFGVGPKEIITDLQTIRYSTNPYNVNAMTMAAGVGVLEEEEYTRGNCGTIIVNRRYTEEQLKAKGFELTDSSANFVFMKYPGVDGGRIYEEMKKRGVLIRHFTKERMAQYNRVTIGSREQMDEFLKVLGEVIEERTWKSSESSSMS